MGLIAKLTKKATNTAVDEATKNVKERISKYKPALIGIGMLIFGIIGWNSIQEHEQSNEASTIFIQNNSTTIYINGRDD